MLLSLPKLPINRTFTFTPALHRSQRVLSVPASPWQQREGEGSNPGAPASQPGGAGAEGSEAREVGGQAGG